VPHQNVGEELSPPEKPFPLCLLKDVRFFNFSTVVSVALNAKQ